MLAIRLQRIGRKKMPMYRVAVQESHRHPSSGRVVAYVGTYNPHDKHTAFDKEKVETFLKNGAQPSPRVVRLLESEKIALPNWIIKATSKKREIRNPEKLRKNQPKAEAPAAVEEAAAPSEPASEEKTEE
ncbi:MAG TPA: 30S ribosomal protein S16 [Candidatus Saccharimonadales bacterium]|nr:30S ribosomal protein S16 [Candidatus Saccharimonadales bacterium]